MKTRKEIPNEFIGLDNSVRELTGISKAIQEYYKETLKLHKMPMSSDCAMSIIDAEVMFRKAITNDLLTLVEINCANCPMGYERDNCKVQSCPFQSIDKIIKNRLEQLSQIRPGGL